MIAVVIGHRQHAQGAVNAHGETEWVWNTTLAQLFANALTARGIIARIVLRPDQPDGYALQAEQLNRLDPDGIVELHFNGGPPTATGTETLHHPSSIRSGSLALAVQQHAVRCLGLRDRGLKPTMTNDRGKELLTLTRTRAPAVIFESHFGSNSRDVEVATAKRSALADALAEAIVEWEP